MAASNLVWLLLCGLSVAALALFVNLFIGGLHVYGGA